MIENWRYQRAVEASRNFSDKRDLRLFLDQEWLTQTAIAHLGTDLDQPPSMANKVGRILMRPEDIPTLRRPFAVEVLGPPGAGKTYAINRYLTELWLEERRNEIAFVPEGARTAREYVGDLRTTDPFTYSVLSSMFTMLGQETATLKMNSGARVILSDRGQIDRRVFRRAFFTQGKVNPGFMRNESEVIDNFENTPMQVGGIIMLLVRPEVSYWSREGDGVDHPVRNMDLLPKLYEQYLRLHDEILEGQVMYRLYTCIDAEAGQEEVYERFKYAMDSILNMQSVFLAAIAQAFPDIYDWAIQEYKRRGPGKSYAEEVLGRRLGGKKVLIVGGDDMESKDEVLYKPLLEAVALPENAPRGEGIHALGDVLAALTRESQ